MPDLGLFDHVDHNRRQSMLLLVSMTALLMAIGALLGSAVGVGSLGGAAVAGAIAVVLVLVAWYRGGDIVLRSSFASEIGKEDDRELVNVVEEMAIAANLPCPRVYIMPERGLNAFASGMRPEDGVIAVTQGLREQLTRDELQAVVAHEMAHIGNRDTRLMVLLAVLVGSIAVLCDFFLRSLHLGGVRRKGGALLLVGVVLSALLAPLVARLLSLAVSRRREYLADATAATLTRNPGALADALEKLGGQKRSLRAANRGTQHLFLVNPFRARSGRRSVFSTHPPLEDRIRRLRRLAGRAYPVAV